MNDPSEPLADAATSLPADVASAPPLRWRLNLLLFIATVASVFLAGAGYAGAIPSDASLAAMLRALPQGYAYALPLLAILLTHEFGHYVAARIHGVPASLPYFIPLPLLSPFGTMGAVISMPERIRSRRALLDIGAAGPLAGLVVAVPVLLFGLHESKVGPIVGPAALEGQSLLYAALKRLVLGEIPAGYDVFLSPVAFAGWCGLFVTALNLLPVGQLDGGHVAYALFEQRQNRQARWIHRGLLLVFAYNAFKFIGPVVVHGAWGQLGQAISNSTFWLMWFGMLHLMARASGTDHPPTEPGELDGPRRVIAVATLILFVALFMPTPWSVY